MDSRTMKALLGVFVALCGGIWLLAFALPAGAAPAATTGNDTCGYPSSSFTESTVMRWAQINGTGSSAQFVAYGNDEKGLLLGVNGATPMSGATRPRLTSPVSRSSSLYVIWFRCTSNATTIPIETSSSSVETTPRDYHA